MATIPVYLTDDDGNEIEQTEGSGDFIIIGFVEQDLFSNTSGLLYTTFYDVVQAATPEQKAEVLRGLRLAKGIRGDLRRFELSGSPSNAYVKYNHSIFGGRYQSQYTALGAIAGTFLRRGGSAFTKELVEAALVSGPFANFISFPSSPLLPGDVNFQVSAGGGTVSAYAWSITDGTTTFNPTGASVTETLTEGTWTVSCVVTIDNSPVVVAGQTLEVSSLVASSVTSSDPTPTVGDGVLFGLTVNDEALLGGVTWSVEMEVPLGASSVFIPVDEDIHFNTVSASGRTATIAFLVGGNYRVTANYADANGQNSASLNIASQDAAPASVGSTTHSTNFSSDLADAYRAGDVHMIVCGDSINNTFSPDRFRFGQSTQWAPARWSGASMSNGNSSLTIPGTGYESETDFTNVTGNKGQGFGVAAEPYVNSTKLDNPIATRRTQEASYMQFESDVAVSDDTFGTAFFTSNEWLRSVAGSGGSTAYGHYTGRLQRDEDTFYRASGAETRVAVYGLNDFTLLAKGATAPQQNVNVTADNYSIITLDRDPSLHTEDSGAESVVQLDFGTNTDIGDGFGLMDMMSYNSNIDGLSLSYLGNGGWNTSNHAPFSERLRQTVADNWYNDDAIENHLRMFGFKSAGVLRDNIVVCLWIQNRLSSEGHVGQMINDLDLWRGRWEAAADAVNASMKANMTFLVCTMPDIIDPNEHEEVGEALAEIAGQTGFENVALLDLNKKLKTEGIDLDAYTGTIAGGSGTQNPLWYGSNSATDTQDGDSVHPRGPGSQAMMGFWWDVVVDEIATPSSAVSFTLNTPANGTDQDTFAFSASGSLPADRLVTWYVDGTKTAYGDSFTLPSVIGTYVVRCVVDAADGGQSEQSHTTTIIGSNVSPAFSSALAVDGSNPTEGDSFNIVFTVTDDNPGDTLTVTFSSTAGDSDSKVVTSGVQDSFTVTAQSGAVTYSASVSDGNGGTANSADLVVTADVPNSAPVIGSFAVSPASGPYTEGDSLGINGTSISDADGDALTYTITYSIDGVDQGSIDTLAPFNGTVSANTATGSHLAATAGDYVFTLTVTDPDGASDTETVAITVDAAASASRIGTILFGTNGDNTNEPDDNGAVDSLFANLSGGGGSILHYTVIDAGPGTRFQINTSNGFLEDTAQTAFGNGINDGTYEWRIDDGAGSYYSAGTATVVVVSTTNARIEFTDFVDSSGTAVAQSLVDARVAAFSDVEIWEM